MKFIRHKNHHKNLSYYKKIKMLNKLKVDLTELTLRVDLSSENSSIPVHES